MPFGVPPLNLVPPWYRYRTYEYVGKSHAISCHFMEFAHLGDLFFKEMFYLFVAWDSSTFISPHVRDVCSLLFKSQAIQQSQLQVVDENKFTDHPPPPTWFFVSPLPSRVTCATCASKSCFSPVNFFKQTILALVEVHR